MVDKIHFIKPIDIDEDLYSKIGFIDSDDKLPKKVSPKKISPKKVKEKLDTDIHIFTDGSTFNNQSKSGNRKGGVGVFFGQDDPRNISFGLKETSSLGKIKVTNNVCELTACIKAIETIISTEKVIGKQIIIYTDSMYIVNSIANWASGWERNGWKKDGGKISNLELIKKLYYYSINMGIIFRHVDAHTSEPRNKNSLEWKIWYGNFMADKLATDGTKSIL